MWSRKQFEKWTDEEYIAIWHHPVVEKAVGRESYFIKPRVVEKIPMGLFNKACAIALAPYNKDSFINLIKVLDNMNAAYQNSLKKDKIRKIKKAARLYNTY